MEAEMKTIIDPKYEPYKKPDNKDNQEAGSINKTIAIVMQIAIMKTLVIEYLMGSLPPHNK